MKCLHIMFNEKFIPDYIKFLEKNFLINKHEFYIIGGNNYEKISKKFYIKNYTHQNNVLRKILVIIGYFRIYPSMIKSEKIILHGLFNPLTIIFLFLNPWFLKKCNWVIWGGDLYNYRDRKRDTLLKKCYFKIENYVKQNCSGYITHIKGDYELAQKWHGAKGNYYDCFMYLSNLYREIKLKQLNKEEVVIQIGNSADLSNNHLEILDKLEKFQKSNIKIYCILSYGDKNWKRKVIEYGTKKFGNKFIPITNFMKFDKYIEFISKIDIAIFAHDRQQGLGNIISLLSMGKTVYLKENVTTYLMLKELGIKIKNFNKLNNLELISEIDIKRNRSIIKSRFSEERLIEDLKKIFN